MQSLGPLYVQKIEYPHRKLTPFIEKGWTNEIEEPYRLGTCLVFRIPFTKPGFVLGYWKYPQDEESALTNAIWGRSMGTPVKELMEWDV
jgi:hypothetical protein